MATITAKGQTSYGYQEIQIIGEKRVKSINCADDAFMSFIKAGIDNALGQMANSYVPLQRTMLQAFAVLTTVFNYQDVIVEGDIGTIPFKPGVIY